MIALIHGSTCGATYSFLVKPHLDGDFGAFQDIIQTRQASLFWWAKSVDKLSFWQCLNPLNLIKIYQTDKNYVQTEIAQTKLAHFLEEFKPNIILAHSVGCDYLVKFLSKDSQDGHQTNYNLSNEEKIVKSNQNKNMEIGEIGKFEGFENLKEIDQIQSKNYKKNLEKILENTKEIYLLNSDWQIKDTDLSPEIIAKVKSKKLIIYNYFCPYDLTLWNSFLVNYKIPDGLFGSSRRFIQNKLFLPYNFPNFHTFLPNNKKFAQKIHQIDILD
jgi:hypothetical protein